MAAAFEAIEAETFWLHIDLDILRSDAFPAVDYPHTAWRTGLGGAGQLAVTAARDRRRLGASIVIYNANLVPGRSAAKAVVDFACRLVERSQLP